MNAKEFVQLTGDFYEALTERIEGLGGTVTMQQLGNTSWLFMLDNGELYSPTEVFELRNDGHSAEWVFRGIKE